MSHKLMMYENLRDMLEREVSEIEKSGDLTGTTLDTLYKIMTSLKDVDKCIDREETSQRYMPKASSAPYRMVYGDMSYDDRMNRGNNFRNYTSRNATGKDWESYEYSRDASKKKMIHKLETLMDDTMSDSERDAIQDCIERIK